METKKFAAFFGPVAKVVEWIGILLHPISFGLGFLFMKSYFVNKALSFGVNNQFTETASYVLSALSGGIIEVGHYIIPLFFFRLLLTIKEWYKSLGTWVMFIFLGAVGYGLTELSVYTSKNGAVNYARSTYEAPTPTDLSEDRNSLSADSLRYENILEEKERSIDADYDARVRDARRPFDIKIAEYQSALATHKDEKRRGYTYADSWIAKRTKQIATASRQRRSAGNDANVGRVGEIEAARKIKTENVEQRSLQFAVIYSNAMKSDSTLLSNTIKSNETLVAFAKSGTVNLVWAIVLVAFFVTFYRVMSGQTYEGEEYVPKNRLGKIYKNFSTMYSDKLDHVICSLEESGKDLKESRGAPKAWQVPRGMTVLRFAVFCMIGVSALNFFIYSPTDFEQGASIMGFSYRVNFAVVFFCFVLLLLSSWKKDRFNFSLLGGSKRELQKRASGRIIEPLASKPVGKKLSEKLSEEKTETSLPESDDQANLSKEKTEIGLSELQTEKTEAKLSELQTEKTELLESKHTGRKDRNTDNSKDKNTAPEKSGIKAKLSEEKTKAKLSSEKTKAKLSEERKVDVHISAKLSEDTMIIKLDGVRYEPNEIADKVRKWYERSFTSAKQSTKDKNKLRYDYAKDQLEGLFNFNEDEKGQTVSIKRK